LGDFVGPIILSDFFAHQDNVFIAGQFFVEGLIDGVAVGDQRHVEKGEEVGNPRSATEIKCRADGGGGRLSLKTGI
jgi:hypothetical protein